jgi:SNF2 family DNA or RNA helicase
LETTLRNNVLVLDRGNRKSRYDFSLSAFKFFEDCNYPIPDEAREIVQGKLNPENVDLSGYPYKSESWPHQIRGQELALTYKRFALFHAMGSGKTKTSLDTIGFLFWKQITKRAIVIAPLSVLTEWPRQIERHSPFGKFVSFKTTAKSKKYLVEELPNEEEPVIFLVNYEKVPSLEKEIADANFGIVIADESTKIKNYRAKRTKSLANIAAQIPYVILMTGTPVSRNLVDVFGQYRVMDPFWLGKSFWMFRQRYLQMGGWMNHQIVGYNREDELREIIDTPSHRILKQEALPNLPPKIHEKRMVQMDSDQKRLYKKTKKDFWVEYRNGGIDIKNAAARIVKLQEIVDGFVFSTEGIEHVSDSKVNALVEVMEEIDPDERIVVWCRFREDIRMVHTAIAESFPAKAKSIFELHGGTKDRKECLDGFRETTGSVLIAQVQTGGMGIDLTCSSNVVFFSNVFEFAMREQAEDRNHRPGQHNAVTYIDLLTEGSVDEKIKEVLESKKSLSEWVMESKGRLSEFFEPRGRFR